MYYFHKTRQTYIVPIDISNNHWNLLLPMLFSLNPKLKSFDDFIFVWNLESFMLQHDFKVLSWKHWNEGVLCIHPKVLTYGLKYNSQHLGHFQIYLDSKWFTILLLLFNVIFDHEALQSRNYYWTFVSNDQGWYLWWLVHFVIYLDGWDECYKAVSRVHLHCVFYLLFESDQLLLFVTVFIFEIRWQDLECLLVVWAWVTW